MPVDAASWKEVVAACVCYMAAWMVWGTFLLKMVRRFHLTGGRATGACLAATVLLAVCLGFSLAGFQAQTTRAAHLPLWLIWLLLGLCMGNSAAYMNLARQRTAEKERK
jgi:hypothetical protein